MNSIINFDAKLKLKLGDLFYKQIENRCALTLNLDINRNLMLSLIGNIWINVERSLRDW